MGDLTPEENERLRRRMKEALETRFKNVTELATAIGRSQPSTSDFLNGKGGASIETARRFANLIKVPVWEILGEAHMPAAAAPAVSVEYDDQFPNRGRAVTAARALGYSDAAIEEIRSLRFAGGQDMEPEEWLEEIRSADRRLRRGAAPVGRAAASDLDVEPPGFEDDKPQPKKGKAKR